MARRALSTADHVLVTASTVPEALRAMGGEPPAIVFVGGTTTDTIVHACKALRAIGAWRAAVIVAVQPGPIDIGPFLDAGADDHLEPRGEIAFQGRFAVARRLVVGRTARRAAEDTRDDFGATLDSIGDGVITTDRLGAVARMNPIAQELTGWRVADARGMQLRDVLPLVNVDTRIAVENPTDRPLREGVVVALPRRTLLIRREGSEIPIADSCAPIRSIDGTITGAVLVFRDLTALKHLEDAHAELQNRLIFADRMASVGTLAAGVAHEINNPLTYVTANLELALEEARGSRSSRAGRAPSLVETLLEAREGVTRVTNIVRGLKTFSRLDEEHRRVVDVVAVLERALALAGNEIRHRARLVRELGPIPPVEADEGRLGQVFVNLLVNAAQSFAGGSMEENEIAVVTRTDPEGRAVVEVRDNGRGIPPDVARRVFDPFFTTKAIGVGTGLGLAMSRSIVIGLGGEISLQSDERGTTFRVALPATCARAPSLPAVTAPSVLPAVRRGTVLVVDDEPAVGTAIQRILRQHDVTVVTSGKDALALLSAGRDFDVVVSDLMMPGMSGMELHSAITRLHPETASRMLFMTGGAFTPEAGAFFDRVANERMSKPFDASELRAVVQRLVG